MQKKQFRLSLLVAILLFFVGGGSGAVLAMNDRARDAAENRKAVAQEHKEATQTRLAENKLRVCKAREQRINNIMDRIGDRGQRHIDRIGKIAERVEAFYTKKGKTVSNYDVLVNDVNAKKAAAQNALNEIKADNVEFKCDGSDPKGTAVNFKDDLKKEIKAIKDYKTAVKNLIVAVKSAQSSTSEGGQQ